jgi:hypothetical protein
MQRLGANHHAGIQVSWLQQFRIGFLKRSPQHCRSALFPGAYFPNNGEVQALDSYTCAPCRAARIRPPPSSLAHLYRQLVPKVRLRGGTKLPARYGGDGAEQ